MNNRYQSFVPAGYPGDIVYCLEPKNLRSGDKTGLFVFMHGGDRDTPKNFPYERYIGPEGLLFPFLDDFPYITIAPSAPDAVDGKRWNRPGAMEYLNAVIDETLTRYNIDTERIIIGGHSMGGFGAFHLGQLLADRAAGVWCSSGAWLEADFRSMYGTPVYILHGKYDCASNYREAHVEPRHHDWCGVSFGRAAHELMLEYGIEHVYDEHEGGHGFRWEPSQMGVRRFLKWALKQKRQPYTPKIALVTPGGSADPVLIENPRSRWLEINESTEGEIDYDKIMLTGPNVAYTIEEFEAQSYYLAKVRHKGSRIIAENMGDNFFSVTAENVKRFSIYLGEEMGDLTKPFTVECNGVKKVCNPVPDKSTAPYLCKLVIEL